MISEQTFMAWWPALCERFNREPSVALAAMYYESLSARLSDEEFTRAASRLFEHHKYGMPAPGDFMEAAGAGSRTQALEQWRAVAKLMSGEEVWPALDSVSHEVVKVLGHVEGLRSTPLSETKWVRKEFLELYETVREGRAREQVPVLAPPTEEVRQQLRGLVPNLLGGGGERGVD